MVSYFILMLYILYILLISSLINAILLELCMNYCL